MPVCTTGQGFAGNANPSYHQDGLIGHSGIDEGCGYGSPVHAIYSGLAYKVLTPERPANDGSGFTGVFQLIDDGLECFEWLTGHITPSIGNGTPVTKADLIGTEANHGKVYSGNIEITLAMQKAGNKEGAHRHYQKRPVIAVPSTSLEYRHLTGPGNGPYYDGSYYRIWNYDNGFNGCISPLQPVFNRNLTIGYSGYDVFVLQRILRRRGLFTADATGFFGSVTAKAVAAYQGKVIGITPTSFFGPVSRSWALRELPALPVLSAQ